MANEVRFLRSEVGTGFDPGCGRAVAPVLVAAILAGAVAGLASAQTRYDRITHARTGLERTVFVSPVPGDPQASGGRLLRAVSSISPSPEDPWLIKIEPGIFDLGTESLVLVPGLEVEGSGETVTVIRGLGQAPDDPFSLGKGVVTGASLAALRDLSVQCIPDEATGRAGCICIANVDAAPLLKNLTLESAGFGNHWGIRNTSSSPLIEEVEIWLEGGTDNYGIVNALGSSPTILRSTISARDGSNLNAGLLDRDGGGPALIEDSQIFASGGLEAIGLFELYGGPLRWVTIDDGVIQASGAESNSAILASRHGLKIQDSLLSGDFAVTVGLGVMDVTSSELSGHVQADIVRMGATRLSAGSLVQGASEAMCTGVYVLSETVQFYAEGCPGGKAAGLEASADQGPRRARRIAGGELG